MEWKTEKRYYTLKTSDEHFPQLTLIAEVSSKKLSVVGNELNPVLMELDRAEYIYELFRTNQPSIAGSSERDNNLYAQVSVDPTGKITLRSTRFFPATLEEIDSTKLNGLKI